MMGSCFSNKESVAVSSDINQSNQDFSLPLNQYVNKIHEITTQEEFNNLITDIQNQNILIVCDFYAIWCPPCLQCAPTIEKWALNDYKTSVIFIKIDVDQNSELSNQYSVRALPTFILFKQGKEIFRLTGADLLKLKKEIDRLK
ncbi:unnamed protein product [Adineta steineri]|uniref:Thioredoxin domain-containing protein n=1 Tax=Adineta steineri TaxID=433720 RepID=A0A815L7S1_9BILA|nr:unnamed protein product [Adineta steineri]